MSSTAVTAAQTGLAERTVRDLASRGVLLGAVKRPPGLGGWWIPAAAVELYLRLRDRNVNLEEYLA